jgi:hypothetical protein
VLGKLVWEQQFDALGGLWVREWNDYRSKFRRYKKHGKYMGWCGCADVEEEGQGNEPERAISLRL